VYKFLLRPKWLALHVLVVALVTIMLMLANWQLNRHQQRVSFNETLIERVNTPTAPLEQVLSAYPTASDAEWRSVQLVGTYLQGLDLRIVNVSQGGGPGFDPVTPLQLPDGRLILVNRGFVPLGRSVLDAPKGTVTLQGRLRASSTKRLGAISDASSGLLTEVQRIDIARLAYALRETDWDLDGEHALGRGSLRLDGVVHGAGFAGLRIGETTARSKVEDEFEGLRRGIEFSGHDLPWSGESERLSKESFNSHGPEYARGGVAHKAPTLRRVLHDPFSHRNLVDNSPAGPRPGGPLPTKFSDVPEGDLLADLQTLAQQADLQRLADEI
jgi:cytochrome oxidase assembly protein ShyY1